MNTLLETAIYAAYQAGLEIIDVYGSAFDVELKDDKTPLTEADKRAHERIAKLLITTEIPILSEEGKEIPFEDRKEWSRFWMVDPLDGTKEFVKRNGEFTVNIALIENGTPVMGVIYVPVTRTLYFSSESGSYKFKEFNGDVGKLEDWISGSKKLPIEEGKRSYTVVGSRSHLSDETKAFVNELSAERGEVTMVSMGSSLKICLVAEGAADIYPRFAPTMEWDTAAGHAILKGAGKELFDYTTNAPMVYNRKNLLNNWFIAK
ncbi:MAG TPA: 3'(2'),5'-bisphosphate nucleotidase CysQ [Cryomorphaceae bacterium]|nr:3'(2'),5'-bisphosphate nucleotidase CysQ [Cryomorphaceae bacterium]